MSRIDLDAWTDAILPRVASRDWPGGLAQFRAACQRALRDALQSKFEPTEMRCGHCGAKLEPETVDHHVCPNDCTRVIVAGPGWRRLEHEP